MLYRTAGVILLVVAIAACHSPPPKRTAAPAPAAALAGGTPELTAGEPVKTVRFSLFKFMQQIGFERDTYTPNGDGGLDAEAIFSFQDRGRAVPLAASYRLGPDGGVRRFHAFGDVARGAEVAARVVAQPDGSFWVYKRGQISKTVKPTGPVMAAAGYAPMLGQALLVQTWQKHGRPKTVQLLPAGQATFESRGKETFEVAGKMRTFEHLAIGGLAWGREDVWLDEEGELFALATRDSEFDHFAAIRSEYAPVMPALMERAAEDAVAWLGNLGRGAARPLSGPVALVGARLVDGTGRPPVEDAVVVYDGDRILAAGPRTSTPIPAGATRIELGGHTILPGLWDMHAHVEQVEQGAAYLAAGVTTVRDVGNVLEFITRMRDSIDAGKGLGPRILVSGIVDGDGLLSLGTMRINRVADIEPVLDTLKKAGALEIKLYSSIRPELVKPIAAAAHRRGLRVTGHIPENMNILEAVAAGYDAVNHIQYIASAVLPRKEQLKLTREELFERRANFDLESPPFKKIFTTLAAKKIVYDPTLALFELVSVDRAELVRREPGLDKMAPELRDVWNGAPADTAAKTSAAFDKQVAMVGALHHHGVTIVAGTDQGVLGHSLHRELELYVKAGMTPMQAIQSATSVPARVMRLEKQVGTVEATKRADLLVVEGNPLADIRDTRKVKVVVARGRMYDPAPLWRLIGFQP